MKILSIPAAVLVLLMQGCGGSSDSDVAPNTIGFSGTISGLVGTLTVSVNGNAQTFDTNGNFILDSRVELGNTFDINVTNDTDGLECVLTSTNGADGSGTATGSINDIIIACSGLDTRAYSINALNFEYNAPSSVVATTMHLINRKTGKAIDELSTDNISDYLTLQENGAAISAQESFIEVDALATLNSDYTTVFAVDISSSIREEELDFVKRAIANLIATEGGESKLLPNQKVSIVTFDSNVQFIARASKDVDVLLPALDSITVGGNSTNLFGAIKQSVDSWNNEISIDGVSYGSLILFTDGNDSSGIVGIEDALTSATNKDIYFITIGQDTDALVLEQFTSPDNVFNLDNFDQASVYLTNAIEHVKTYENGLYIVSYATPKRAGEHQLTIKTNDDYNCQTAVSTSEEEELSNSGTLSNCVDELEYTFNAANFTDVQPRLDITGVEETLADSVEWQARVRWTNEDSRFQWSTQNCLGRISSEISGNNIVFTREQPGLSLVKVTVNDTSTQTTRTKYLFMADNQTSLNAALNIDPRQPCSF